MVQSLCKRKPSECKMNNYKPHVMLAWQASMDIQYVVNAYACVMYVACYIIKTDDGMGELLRCVEDSVLARLIIFKVHTG